MKKIADKLYQASATLGFEVPKEATVVFWLCGLAPKKDYAMSKDRLLIDFQIPDDPSGLDPVVFDELVDYARAYKDSCCVTVCQMGENRSGLLSTLILIARGMDTEEAIKTVQSRGNQYSINAHNLGRSFWNPGFVAQVRRAFGKRET